MAEIRKHNPSTSAIGDAVRKALGEDIRPVQPGRRQVHDADDPYAPDETAIASTPQLGAGMFTLGEASGQWFTVTTTSNEADD